LSDKDFIKDLFQEQLGNIEVPVNPDLWAGIQSQLCNVAAASGTAASAGTKVAVFSKIAVAASIVTASVIGIVYFASEEETIKQEVALVETAENSKEEIVSSTDDGATTSQETEQKTSTVLAPPVTPIIDDSGFDEAPINVQPTKTNANSTTNPAGENTPKTQMNDPRNISSGLPQQGSPQQESHIPSELQIAIAVDRRDNQHYRFKAESNGEKSKYLWDFGDGTTSSQLNPEHFFSKGGTYQVSLTVMDGARTKTVYHQVEVKTPGKFTNLPNIFTPNNDGSNDEFFVESQGLAELTVVVLNQKNEIVFESNVIDFRWDGRDRRTGMLVDKGVYYYMISAIDKDGNNLSKHNRLEVNY
jgi:hypothetical protein